MTHTPPLIRRALISVSDKTGLIDLARDLIAHNVEILSTGGSARTLRDAGIAVTDVSSVTQFPEIMDGRVKTLHPKIHGGILAKRDKSDHQSAMHDHDITGIDLVIVNLYPFEQTVAAGHDADTCIENIDIGGPAMVRAAAKNFAHVTIVTNPSDYNIVSYTLPHAPSLDTRKSLAHKAFAMTAAYDSAVQNWFAHQQGITFPDRFTLSAHKIQDLRYGENPHQQSAVYRTDTSVGVVNATQIQGKELSFNNLNDTDAAFALVCEFEEPAVAIIKHANPCGVAVAPDCLTAYTRALACDPVSAFGGIIALNRPLDAATASEIIKIFSEVIIAPAILPEAREILKTKDKIRVLETGSVSKPTSSALNIRTLMGGILVQTADTAHIAPSDVRVVTKHAPTHDQMRDMLFAFTVCKHVKSNAIIYAKDGRTLGIGAGQMSRIDSTRIAAIKAREANLDLAGSVVASDAFFPFADGLIAAAEAGAVAIIQPGGSIKDADVIAAADSHNLSMVFTGLRHFRH
jgi:phosphoribosylaminoimidazolecarboxamide formyltransferase / IMP cyclohydrolase